ncbi:hypothetical protein C5167_020640 [Papaver somniferum]|uniref:Uncharacterized protein n=1 Tax=Papaver somniferum TaxID=3469 RepID=A0A4Y7IXK9_PAPSO|nr:hypothetical protein C5167_020640 [Papaver somniferum]
MNLELWLSCQFEILDATSADYRIWVKRIGIMRIHAHFCISSDGNDELHYREKEVLIDVDFDIPPSSKR